MQVCSTREKMSCVCTTTRPNRSASSCMTYAQNTSRQRDNKKSTYGEQPPFPAAAAECEKEKV